MVRTILYVLLPISIRHRARAGLQGSIQNFSHYLSVTGSPASADDRDGPGRLAGGDQDARHQRRRLLQRQLGAPVREPDGFTNFFEMLSC
jgi:hypothetical protein